MKTYRIVLLAVVFALAVPSWFAGGTDTAGAEETPIEIVFDGEPLATDATPYIQNGTTFVPFRALFEALGMQVSWEAGTRKVTGRNHSVTIELTVDSRTATVNGNPAELALPPAVVAGRAFVPLRFVSEAASAQVEWIASERRVKVDSASAAVRPSDAAVEAYREFSRLANREQYVEAKASIHPDSPLLGAVIPAWERAFARRDVQTTIEFASVESIAMQEATLLVTERHEKSAGAFYMDNRTRTRVTMKKLGAGKWMLYDALLLERQWLVPFGSGAAETTFGPDDEAGARTAIAAYLEALEQENEAQALRRIDSGSPERAVTETALRWMFANYDFTHRLESLRVLERSGDEMYVYAVQTTRKVSGPKFADVRTEVIYTLRLQPNGEWKLFSTIQGEKETLSLPQ